MFVCHEQWDHQNTLSCDQCARFDPKALNVRSCDPGDSFNLPTRQFQVEVFGMTHSVPCVGYGIAPFSGGELDFPKGFIYCGDTSIQVFDKSVWACCYWMYVCLSHEWQILERCRRDGHIYWKQLEPVIQRHPDVHFSLRYSIVKIFDFFCRVNLENLSVVCSKVD